MLHCAPRRRARQIIVRFGRNIMAGTTAQLIYNPNSGTRDWSGVIGRFVDFWNERGWAVHATSTEYAGHAPILAREAVERGVDVVFAAGGDGTLNEITNALVGSDTALAPLPTGTANVFARELGMKLPNPLSPNWLVPVYQSLSRGRIQRIDVGKCATGRHWLLWASAGFDGFVVHNVEPRSRQSKRLGKIGYLADAVRSVFKFRSAPSVVTADGQVYEGEYLLINISNCRMFLGGEFNLNPRGVFDDGLFEVFLFKGRDWSKLPIYAMDVTLDVHEDNPDVVVVQARNVAVETRRPIPYHLDGEPAANTPFAVQIVPKALRVLIPDSTPDGLFREAGEPIPS